MDKSGWGLRRHLWPSSPPQPKLSLGPPASTQLRAVLETEIDFAVAEFCLRVVMLWQMADIVET